MSVLLYPIYLLFEDQALHIFDMIGVFSGLMTFPLTYFILFFVVAFIFGMERITLYVKEYLEKQEAGKRELVTEVIFEAHPDGHRLLPSEEEEYHTQETLEREKLIDEEATRNAAAIGGNIYHSGGSAQPQEEQHYHGYAFSEENNPNPQLLEQVLHATTQRMSIHKKDRPLIAEDGKPKPQ